MTQKGLTVPPPATSRRCSFPALLRFLLLFFLFSLPPFSWPLDCVVRAALLLGTGPLLVTILLEANICKALDAAGQLVMKGLGFPEVDKVIGHHLLVHFSKARDLCIGA